MKIALFYHMALMGNYEEVTQEIFTLINKSGLRYNIDQLIVNECKDLIKCEFPTLEMLREFSIKNKEYYVLYLHTKGVTRPNFQPITDWRNCMLYFLVENWKKCITLMDRGDQTVGVSYIETPAPHYQGNFWWAKSNYIATLPDIVSLKMPQSTKAVTWEQRHKCEFWLMQNNPKFTHIYHHARNPYKDINPIENYIGKFIIK